MDHHPDWRLELSPADLCTQYTPDGSVASALTWAEMVADGRLAEAWPRTGPLFRLTLTRHWCWRNRAALHRDGHDPALVAAALADDGPAHVLWPMFARSQRPPGAGDATATGMARWVAAGPPEPIGPDLEVVELLAAESAMASRPTPALTLLLRLGPAGWLVDGHGRSPVQPGWPPCR